MATMWDDDPFADIGGAGTAATAPQQTDTADPFNDIPSVSRGTLETNARKPGTLTAAEEADKLSFIPRNIEKAGLYGLAMLKSSLRNTANIPHMLNKNIPAVDPTGDYYAELGLDKGIGSTIGETILDFLPFAGGANLVVKGAKTLPKVGKAAAKAVEKFPNLIKGSLASGAMGGTYAPEGETLKGLGIGTALGAVGVGAGKAGDLAYRWGLKKYAQSGIPGLVEHATEKLKGLRTDRGAEAIQKNFIKAQAANTQNWTAARAVATELDTALKNSKVPFDNTRFTQTIEQRLKDIGSKDPAIRAQHEAAAGFANHIKSQAPESFEGAIALRQNLNQELKKYLDKTGIKITDAQTKKLATDLKKTLDETIKDNRKNVPEELFNRFETDWAKANKSHQELQEFFKRPDLEGHMKVNKRTQEALQNKSLAESALGKYFRPGARGTEGLEQLNKLAGGLEGGQRYQMRNVIENRGAQDALDLYEKLSPAQRKYLYGNTPQGESLEAASKIKEMFGRPRESKTAGLGHHIGAYGIPGVLGYGAATAMGANWHEALLAGIGAGLTPKISGALTRKIAGKKTPEVLLKAAEKAQKKGKAGKVINPFLTASGLDLLFPGRE